MGAGTTAKNYDGTNDYATRGADLTGASDGKEITIFFWVKFNGGDDGAQTQVDTTGSSVRVLRIADFLGNNFRLVLENTSGSQIVNIDSSSTLTTADGWTPVLLACDAVAGNAYIYFGDTQEASKTDVADNNINLTPGDWSVGGRTTGAGKSEACFSEIWIDDTYIDPTVESNRRKFFDASGDPVELGSDGSTPTGAAPLIYAPNGDPSTNAGTGGNFTITGALTDCADAPADSGPTAQAISATHTSTASISKDVMANRTIAATLNYTAVVAVKLTQAISATISRTAAMTRNVFTPKTISATAVYTASMTRLKTFQRSIAGTITRTASITRRKTFFRTIAATITRTASLAAAFIKPVTIAATVTRTAALSTIKTIRQDIAATITRAASISKQKTFFRTIAVVATNTAEVIKKMFVEISATHTMTANFTQVAKIVPVTIAATITATAAISAVIIYAMTIAATAVYTALVRQAKKLFMDFVMRLRDNFSRKTTLTDTGVTKKMKLED